MFRYFYWKGKVSDVNRLIIAGHTFQTKSDYDAALRDKAKIDKIRKETDFADREQVLELYRGIEAEEYQFEGILGREFDDEIFELKEELKKQKKTEKNGKKSAGKKKGNTGKLIHLDDYEEGMKQQILLEIQKKEKRRKLITIVGTVIACVSFGYLCFYYVMSERTTKQTEQLATIKETGDTEINLHINKDSQDTVQKEILEEYKKLYNLNKKLIGWIKIDDTLIDNPVMQTSNNEYYLDHNFDQEYDKNGSVFMDAQCDALNRSTNLILYGHNMKSGKMFGSLKNYTSESYYKKHPYIKFDTIYEKGTYQIMYVFRSKVYTEDVITFKYYQFIDAISEEEFTSNMAEMSKLSFYDTGVTAEYGEQLLTLSTCDYNEPNGRLVIVAKQIQE